jgi:hypothetical protein
MGGVEAVTTVKLSGESTLVIEYNGCVLFDVGFDRLLPTPGLRHHVKLTRDETVALWQALDARLNVGPSKHWELTPVIREEPEDLQP